MRTVDTMAEATSQLTLRAISAKLGFRVSKAGESSDIHAKAVPYRALKNFRCYLLP
jgi:hypothetical protein